VGGALAKNLLLHNNPPLQWLIGQNARDIKEDFLLKTSMSLLAGNGMTNRGRNRRSPALPRSGPHEQNPLSDISAVAGGGRVRFDYPTLRKEREGWGTRQLVAGIANRAWCAIEFLIPAP
jgi:hypothetical protein